MVAGQIRRVFHFWVCNWNGARPIPQAGPRKNLPPSYRYHLQTAFQGRIFLQSSSHESQRQQFHAAMAFYAGRSGTNLADLCMATQSAKDCQMDSRQLVYDWRKSDPCCACDELLVLVSSIFNLNLRTTRSKLEVWLYLVLSRLKTLASATKSILSKTKTKKNTTTTNYAYSHYREVFLYSHFPTFAYSHQRSFRNGNRCFPWSQTLLVLV